MEQDQPKTKCAPKRRLHGMVQRIIKYYLRRDCEKCCSRLEGTYEIAWLYDEEAAHQIERARALLATAKARLR